MAGLGIVGTGNRRAGNSATPAMPYAAIGRNAEDAQGIAKVVNVSVRLGFSAGKPRASPGNPVTPDFPVSHSALSAVRKPKGSLKDTCFKAQVLEAKEEAKGKK